MQSKLMWGIYLYSAGVISCWILFFVHHCTFRLRASKYLKFLNSLSLELDTRFGASIDFDRSCLKNESKGFTCGPFLTIPKRSIYSDILIRNCFLSWGYFCILIADFIRMLKVSKVYQLEEIISDMDDFINTSYTWSNERVLEVLTGLFESEISNSGVQREQFYRFVNSLDDHI